MKILYSLLLLFSGISLSAQDLSKCEKLMEYQYHVIDSIPMSKIEIYHKVHSLMAQWYPGYPAIIQLADSNSGMIMVSGTNSLMVPTGYRSQTVSRPYNHRMKIECRENRLRIGIYYQTIVEHHSAYINLRRDNPRLISEKKYIESLKEYSEICMLLQGWIDDTFRDFEAGITRPADNW